MTAATLVSVLQYAESLKLMIDGNNAHRVLGMHIPNIVLNVRGVTIIAELHFIILRVLYDTNSNKTSVTIRSNMIYRIKGNK